MTEIGRIRDALTYVCADDRDTWLRMGMAIKSEVGDPGFDTWNEWSQQAPSYNARDARDVWKSIRVNGMVTAGTLFHEAKARGWRDDGTRHKPTPEELADRKRIAAERAAQDETEIARERAATARKAAAIWRAATPASPDHPYLQRKRVSPVATLREIDADQAAAILGYVPKSDGDKLAGSLLVIPVKQANEIPTLELIDRDGRKTALAGRGTKAGGFWAAQPLPDELELLAIGEGVITVLSGREATGAPVVAALSSSNLRAVARTMRERYPAGRLVILADLVKETGEPDPHAIEAARAVGGLLAVPDFGPDREPGQTDFNDMAQVQGPEAVQLAIAGAIAPVIVADTDDVAATDFASATRKPAPILECSAVADKTPEAGEIEKLAALPAAEYDRERKDAAKKLGIRVRTLDAEVERLRPKDSTEGIGFDDIEPWHEAIDLDQLLEEIAATVRRFIICQVETARAVALWAAMTWLMDVIQIAPLAVITAPEKRCGKSLLLFLLGRLVHRPLTASNITPAALFRSIDAWRPTLLVDEADAFMKENEELRGLLNCGHTRDSAYIVRVVGDDHTPTKFTVWGAKAIAGIGRLADTLMDRSITLELRRKLPHESVERLRYVEPGLFETLAAKLARFAGDHSESVRLARPELPPSLNDRAQDNWEPLLAIADVAGGRWPSWARDAALKLSGAESPTESIGTELLADIKEVFHTRRVERLPSTDLLTALCEDDEAPWATYNRGKPMSTRQLARKLDGYGIRSRNIRFGMEIRKGYEAEDFKEAWSRYIPLPATPSVSATSATSSNGAAQSVADAKTVSATAPLVAATQSVEIDL